MANPFFATIVEEIASYLEREMLHRGSGAFYSATDADSEGEEGKYFVWYASELESILGSSLAQLACAYWGVTREGNFEGRNILHRPRTDESVADELKITAEALKSRIAEAKRILYSERLKRVPPLTDDKAITSWNALAMKAFAEAGTALQRPDWIEVAESNAEFISARLTRSDGRLMRSRKIGSEIEASIPGFLEDHAYLADALLTLYESTFDIRWLEEATRICSAMIDLFWDPETMVFYDTGSDQTELIVRPRDIFDNAQPSGSSAAALALLRCAAFTGHQEHARVAVANLRSVRDLMERAPSAFPTWLQAAQLYANPTKQVVIVGKKSDHRTQDLLDAARSGYHPDRIVAHLDPDAGNSLPLFEERRTIDGKPTAYVCRDFACELPVTDVEAMIAQLQGRQLIQSQG